MRDVHFRKILFGLRYNPYEVVLYIVQNIYTANLYSVIMQPKWLSILP